MSAFVGTCIVKSDGELRSLIQQLKRDKFWGNESYFFLRWPHKVSNFLVFSKDNLPNNFPSPEGQLFDDEKELRWKQNKGSYLLLLLSTNDNKLYPDFKSLANPEQDNTVKWETYDQNAHLYPSTETRFPKRIAEQPVNIGQRYFVDAQTATVHFVALRVDKNHDY